MEAKKLRTDKERDTFCSVLNRQIIKKLDIDKSFIITQKESRIRLYTSEADSKKAHRDLELIFLSLFPQYQDRLK